MSKNPNPLLTFQELPDFNSIKAEHFEPAIDKVLDDFNNVLTSKILLESDPTWKNTILPLEIAENNFSKVWNVINHLNSVYNIEEVRTEYEKVLPKVTDFFTDLSQNVKLYEKYLALKNKPEFAHYDNAKRIIIEHAIRDFKLSGVDLPEVKKQRLKVINQRLSELGNKFSKNIIDSTLEWNYHIKPEQQELLAGLPEHTIARAKAKAENDSKQGWILTLDFPCYYSVMTYAKNRELRKEFYHAYSTRASEVVPTANKFDNTKIISEIIQLRQELANILGLENYAEYSLIPKMAENTEQVSTFIHDLVTRSKSQASKEYKNLVTFAKEQDGIDAEAWDLSYYAEIDQKIHYDIDQEQLRNYFPESQVLKGMFNIAEKLFSIKIEEIPNPAKWHDTVKLFAVTDADKKLRGKFYVDLYARDFKRSGAWMHDFIGRFRQADGKLQTPVAFLVANFTPPVADKPALLSHNEVVTLFHEFGHTLHHILTQVDHPSVAGTSGVAWDAVELPSQFMENWAWEWEVLQDLSKHYQSNEPLPEEEFKKLLAVKNYNSAMQMIRQLEFSWFDFRLHLNNSIDQGRTSQQILDEVRQEIAVVPVPTFNRFQNSFSHIFDGGYAAGYYSYKWAEVLSCDAFEKFIENGGINPEIGKQFLHTILEQGGSREAIDLFVEFRGRKPTVDALSKHNRILDQSDD